MTRIRATKIRPSPGAGAAGPSLPEREWRVRAEYPLVRVPSPLFTPVFRSNHYWVIRQGAHSMFLEMLRRRAATPEDLAAIPAPPGPVPPYAVGRDRFLRRPDIWDHAEPRDRSESIT